MIATGLDASGAMQAEATSLLSFQKIAVVSKKHK
jgi:hypothetical protein